jgi:hypothetical protein
LDKVGFDWQRGNPADGEEGRRIAAVPGEGSVNTGR